MYQRSINQIINAAMINAINRCNKVGNKRKRYLKKAKNRQKLRDKK